MTPQTQSDRYDRTVIENGEIAIDPLTRAYIHVLRSLNVPQQTIADDLGLKVSVVSRVLLQTRDAVENGGDPVDIYAETVGPLHELRPVGKNTLPESDDNDAEVA